MSYGDLNEQIISSIFNNGNYDHLYHQARCFDCHSCQGMFFFFALWVVKEIDNLLMQDTFVVSFELVNNTHC